MAAMMRPAGSPGIVPSNVPARRAISALTGSKRSSGSWRRSASQFSRGTVNSRRPLRTAVAISSTLIADTAAGAIAVRIARETDDHWERLESLLGGSGMAGNPTADAHLAVLALERRLSSGGA